MTTTRCDGLAERIGLFDQAATYALEILARVSTEDLDRPTPCRDWAVRDVVLHLADIADAVVDLLRNGEFAMPAPRDADTPEPVAATQERIGALREAISAGHDAQILLSAAQGGANELAAHGWDIASALGLRTPIPDETATTLLALVEGHLGADERGTNFAPAAPVSAAASPSDRFAAYLGRQPSSSN